MENIEPIYTFKKDVSQQELEEIIGWFEARMDKLPETMHIDKATYTGNLPATVKSYLNMLKGRTVSVTLCGYIAHLGVIRKRLQLGGME